MAFEPNELVDELLERIVLSGNGGFDYAAVREALESIFEAKVHRGSDRSETTEHDDFNPRTLDDSVLATILERLNGHSDIQSQTSGNDQHSRYFQVKEDRKWRILTGHHPKTNVLPLEFDLLSVIAAHGPAGLVQGQAAKITGQDKRSVPQRTDALAAKGYISKTAALLRGQETSLLRLKKYVRAERGNHDVEIVHRDRKGISVIDLCPLLPRAVELVRQQPNSVMAIQDLGLALGFRINEFDYRRLMQCVRRLANTGCFRKCSAVAAAADEGDATGEIKCVQLVHEPTASDEVKWLTASFVTGAKARKQRAGRDSDGESEGDDDDGPDLSLAHAALDTPLPTLISTIIEEAGSAGISSSGIYERLPGAMSRSALDGVLTKITASRTVQPRHLRHMRVVVAVNEEDGGLIYRTLGNHMERTDNTQTPSKVSNSDSQGLLSTEEGPTDGWGFPKLAANLFGRGTAQPVQPPALIMPRKPGRPPKQRYSFVGLKQPPVQTAVREPKPITRPRITSERDEEVFGSWAKVTAERLARSELQSSSSPVNVSTEEGPARKRRRTDCESPDPEQLHSRIAEIEADLLCRDRPGVYINPPGAKDTKAQYFVHVGRPRNALIAVIRSERLKTLSWFKDDGVRMAPLASRRRTTIKGMVRIKDPDAGKVTLEQPDGSSETSQLDGAELETMPATEITKEATDDLMYDAALAQYKKPLEDLSTQSQDNRGQGLATPPISSNSPRVDAGASPHLPAAPPSEPRPSSDEEPQVALDTTTYNKAYVTAHSHEEFHHVGAGYYKRGPHTSKKRRRLTNFEAEQPQRVAAAAVRTSYSPASPNQVKRTRRSSWVKGDDAALPTPEALPTLTVNVDGDTHESRDAAAHGLDKDRAGPVEETRHNEEIAQPEVAEKQPAMPAVPELIYTALGSPAAQDSPERFDKAYVLVHKDEQFHHVGHGRYKRGPKPGKLPSKAASVSRSLPPTAAAPQAVESVQLTAPPKILSDASEAADPVTPSQPAAQTAVSTEAEEAPTKELDETFTGDDENDLSRSQPQRTMSMGAEMAVVEDMSTPAAQMLSDADLASKENVKEPRKTIELVLDIIRLCGGVFPGNREIWFPYATAYEQRHYQVAQRMPVDRAVKALVDSAKLKKLTFTFRAKAGTNETRNILYLPDIDRSSERITMLKKGIIDSFPSPCIPHEAAISETLRKQHGVVQLDSDLSAEVSPPKKFVYVKRWPKYGETHENEFPAIDGLVVQRTEHALGLTKAQEAQPTKKAVGRPHKSSDAPTRMQEKRTTPTKAIARARQKRNANVDQSSSEWLRLRAGQTFYPSSGVFGTNGMVQALSKTVQPPSIQQTNWSSAAATRIPTAPDMSSSKRRFTESKAKVVVPDKHWVRYQSQVNQVRYQDVGGGRYLRVDDSALPPETVTVDDMRYDKSHVQSHPDQSFYHVGHGRYKQRGELNDLEVQDILTACKELATVPTKSSPVTPSVPQNATKEKETWYDKAYVHAHPDQNFYHAGFGRYKPRQIGSDSSPAPQQEAVDDDDMRWDEAHVQSHPDQDFYHVGNGRYKRKPIATGTSPVAPHVLVPLVKPLTKEVEAILGCKIKQNAGPVKAGEARGTYKVYLVKWKGDEGKDTWERMGNLAGAQDLVTEFEQREAEKSIQPAALSSTNAAEQPEVRSFGRNESVQLPAPAPVEFPSALPPSKPTDKSTSLLTQQGSSLAGRPNTPQSARPKSSIAPIHGGGTANGRHLAWLQPLSAKPLSDLTATAAAATVTAPSEGTPVSPTEPVQTSRSGRPLYMSRKRKANSGDLLDTLAPEDAQHFEAPEETQSPKRNYTKRARLESVEEDTAPQGVENFDQPLPTSRAWQTTRAAREFPHADELVIVLTLVKTLCAGLDQTRINWDVVAHGMACKYEPAFLQARWGEMKRWKEATLQQMVRDVREPFLTAYARDELPRVDFKDLSATDWPALVAWARKEVVPKATIRKATPVEVVDAVELPNDSQALRNRYSLALVDDKFGPVPNHFFDSSVDTARAAMGLQLIHGTTKTDSGDHLENVGNPSVLLKSWCRAVAVTPEHHYDAQVASSKISAVFSNRLVKQATDELVASQILRVQRKGRQLPGRNYTLDPYVWKVFLRWPTDDQRGGASVKHDDTWPREVAAARHNVMAAFEQHPQLTLSYHTNDFEIAVLTNMVAQGLLKISTTLPTINNDFNAPFPRLSVWGVDEPHTLYNSHAVERARLRFPITYAKTPTFTPNHGLKRVPIPTQPATRTPGELAARIPLWIDIHGNLIDYIWDTVLRSVLHLVVYRPGTTAQAIEKAHEGKLWAWEAEMVLMWMEETGLAIGFGPGKEGEEGRWLGGWRASEWWYCAFAEDIATWKALGVVSG